MKRISESGVQFIKDEASNGGVEFASLVEALMLVYIVDVERDAKTDVRDRAIEMARRLEVSTDTILK